ncbi:sensor histidine kinase [Nannocystaceae bacterium ST9]
MIDTPDSKTGEEAAERSGTQFARIRSRMGREQLFLRRRDRLRIYLVFGSTSAVLEWGLLWYAGVEPWRIGVLVLLFFLPLAFGLAKRDRPPPTEQRFARISLVFQFHMAVRLALTGGLHSPLLPALGAMIVQPVIILGPHRTGFRLGASMLALVLLVGLLPTWVTGPTILGWPYAALLILAFAYSLVIVGEFMKLNLLAQERATEAIVALYDERVAEAEAQSRRLQAVGGKVAHELKNPLAAIKGLVQLLARGATEERTQQRLEVVQGEISRMEVILREYLSFSRPLEDLEPEQVDLAALVEHVAVVIAGRADHAQVRVTVEAEPVGLVGDPRRLQEALLNLLANAIEATPPGGAVRISTRAEPDGARVEIVDTGRGIRPEHLERLGASFFTTRREGNGLGVVLVVGVVAQHGGRLHFASEPSRGTRVTLWLPSQPTPVASGTKVLTSSSTLSGASA